MNNYQKNKEKDYYYKIISNEKIKKLIIIMLMSIMFSKMKYLISSQNNNDIKYKLEKLVFNHKNKFNKWIVLNAFNPPSSFIINLEKIIEGWKIVVIGNNNIDDIKWEIFSDSEKLIYLSIETQNCLNYNITNYLKINSSFRKIIGYLFAIEYGAKEIFEIDEDLQFNDLSEINKHFEKHKIAYVSNNNSLEINPYIFLVMKIYGLEDSDSVI